MNSADKNPIRKALWGALWAGMSALMAIFSLSPALAQAPSPQTLVTPAPTREPAGVVSGKRAVLERARELRDKQIQVLNNIDSLIGKKLQETTTVSLKGPQASEERRVTQITDSLSELTTRRSEYNARREFLDELTFQLDTQWSSQPLKAFLEHQLLNMATNDLNETSKTHTRMWQFLVYLSIAVRELPEPREDLLTFIEGYMNFAGVLDPKSPVEFVASRNYTNGSTSLAAKPFDRDKLGEYAEKRMRELGITDQPTNKVATRDKKGAGEAPQTSDIQIRLAPPTLPTSPPRAADAKASPGAASSSGASQPYISPSIAQPEPKTTLPPREPEAEN